MTGKLYLIPNYIGNTDARHQFPDWNRDIISGLTYFFVENPKPARALIKSMNKEVDFDAVELFTFDKHAKDNMEVYQAVIQCLKNGNDVGVLSDAGCPGIADPGSALVKKAHEHGVEVVPLIGPSSVFLTLMGSGLNGQLFQFKGYLPKEAKDRAAEIRNMEKEIRSSGITYLFIETPYKNETTFSDLLNNLSGGVNLCIGLDLFSAEQRIITYPVSQWKSLKSRPGLKDRQVVFAIG